MSFVLITGATGGIGEAIAKKFADNGYGLILTGNKNTEKLTSLSNELSAKVPVYGIPADLSSLEGCEKVFRFCEEKKLDVQILVNNAGISHSELFQDSDDENYQEILNTNLSSYVRLTKLFVPSFIRKKSGSIVNISSVFGERGSALEVEYCLTKSGINGFTKALAKELGPSGISVNAIAPGLIDTKMNSAYSAEEIEELEKEIPFGRMGKPEEVAEAVFFLAKASYITGQILTVDGGWMC